jgi:hypothetical protein
MHELKKNKQLRVLLLFMFFLRSYIASSLCIHPSITFKSSTCLPWFIISSMDGGLVGSPQRGIILRGGFLGLEGGGLLGLEGGILHCGGTATKGGGWLGPEGGTLPRGSKCPTPSGGIAIVEGGFLGPTGGIKHGGGIATMGGGWLGPEGGTLPRGSKSPTTPGGIAEYGCASAIIIKSAVSSVSATVTTIDDAAPAMLFLLLAMASL